MTATTTAPAALDSRAAHALEAGVVSAHLIRSLLATDAPNAVVARVGLGRVFVTLDAGARGTCATMLEALGYPPRLIADILGQADVRITETHYARSDAWQRADAVNDVAGLFELEAGA